MNAVHAHWTVQSVHAAYCVRNILRLVGRALSALTFILHTRAVLQPYTIDSLHTPYWHGTGYSLQTVQCYYDLRTSLLVRVGMVIFFVSKRTSHLYHVKYMWFGVSRTPRNMV